MVRLTDTRTIVAYRTQAARIQELSQTALIDHGGDSYTSTAVRPDESVGRFGQEAPVNINPLNSVRPPQTTTPVDNAAAKNVESSKLAAPTDEVTLSSEAIRIAESEQSPSLREARIAQIQAEIEAGTYDTEERFDAAVEQMLKKIL